MRLMASALGPVHDDAVLPDGRCALSHRERWRLGYGVGQVGPLDRSMDIDPLDTRLCQCPSSEEKLRADLGEPRKTGKEGDCADTERNQVGGPLRVSPRD